MFRFTNRDVLWLMVVVGPAIGWMSTALELINRGKENQRLKQSLRHAIKLLEPDYEPLSND